MTYEAAASPDDAQREATRRPVLLWKAAGLFVALGAVGIALVVVLWLLATLTISLLGSL